jgi:hypothetical protein
MQGIGTGTGTGNVGTGSFFKFFLLLILAVTVFIVTLYLFPLKSWLHFYKIFSSNASIVSEREDLFTSYVR